MYILNARRAAFRFRAKSDRILFHQKLLELKLQLWQNQSMPSAKLILISNYHHHNHHYHATEPQKLSNFK